MTAVKPTDTVDWSAAGVEPPAGKKSGGWATSERPPANWWNWLLTTISAWVTYLDNGDIAHGDKQRAIPAGLFIDPDVYEGSQFTLATTSIVVAEAPIEIGERIKSVRFYLNYAGTGNVTLRFFKRGATGTRGAAVSTATYSSTGVKTFSVSASTRVEDEGYEIEIDNGSTMNATISNVSMTYDRPSG